MFKMVDVVTGKLTLKEVEREIRHYMLKSPKRLIVDIQLDIPNRGYHTTIWIPKSDFRRKC